jgi:hypothetical protein
MGDVGDENAHSAWNRSRQEVTRAAKPAQTPENRINAKGIESLLWKVFRERHQLAYGFLNLRVLDGHG